jgi:hypothetical protein
VQRLKLKCGKLLGIFAFNTNLRHCIKAGTTLVLYNFASRTLSGPYEALTAPKWNTFSDAWQGRGVLENEHSTLHLILLNRAS